MLGHVGAGVVARLVVRVYGRWEDTVRDQGCAVRTAQRLLIHFGYLELCAVIDKNEHNKTSSYIYVY